MRGTGLLLTQLEPFLHLRIIFFGIIEHPVAMCLFYVIALFYILTDPVAHLAVCGGVFDQIYELFEIYAGKFEPNTVETLPEVGLINRVQFAGEMQSDFVDEAWQMHPA